MIKNKQKPEWDKVAGYWDKLAGDTGDWHKKNDIDPIILKILGNIRRKKILD